MAIDTRTAALAELAAGLEGELLTPDLIEFDAACAVWNGRHRRRPAALVRCASPADVGLALAYARRAGLPVGVRGGGHSLAGHAQLAGGLMLDMTPMRALAVDAAGQTVRAEAGVLAGELSAALQEHGLAVPLGGHAGVGVAGLTLGGGVGWLLRRHGLTIDSLLAAELITADGRAITASAEQHPELFWALRGGGGNFGVVTALRLRAYPLGPMVFGGSIVYPLDQAEGALRFLRAFMAEAPDGLTCVAALATAPSAPQIPEGLRGRPALMINHCYAGPVVDGAAAVAPLRAYGQPAADLSGPRPYLEQSRGQELPPGLHHDGTSGALHTLNDATIHALVSRFAHVTSPLAAVQLICLGGAVGRVDPQATAFAHRRAGYLYTISQAWPAGDDGGRHTAWMRGLKAALAPHSTGGAYVNMLGEEGPAGVRAAYPEATYERLRAVKRLYDPANIFRGNHNIEPGEEEAADIEAGVL